MPGSKPEAEPKPSEMATTTQEAKNEVDLELYLRATGGVLDVNKIYRWSEACAIRDAFVRLVNAHAADQNSWFAAYQVQKISWANKGIVALDREKLMSMHFETYEQVIEFMERLLKAMGYAIQRRSTFELIKTVPADKLLADADHMVSLLLSEYEWENSLKYFQADGKDFGPAKYKIMEDGIFTPHGAPAGAAHAGFEDVIMRTVQESMRKTLRPVQQRLDFDDVSSADSTPLTKPARSSMKPLPSDEKIAQGLLKLASEGDLTVDEITHALRKLKSNDTDRTSHGTYGTKASSAAQPTKDDRPTKRPAPYEVDDWNDAAWFEQDARPMNGLGERYVTTVLQNVQLRTFDGRNRSTEEAKQWLAKFMHAANLSNWTPRQRLETFANNLGGSVRFWFKQLPAEARQDWRTCSQLFRKRYCTEVLSVSRLYYKTEQRQDERASEYLYRLNAAALRAGVPYQDDYDALTEHLELFFDTANEKSLPHQLRYRKFSSIEELEKVLIQHEATHGKVKKNPTQHQAPVHKQDHPRLEAKVNAVEAAEETLRNARYPTDQAQYERSPTPQRRVHFDGDRQQQRYPSERRYGREGPRDARPPRLSCEECGKGGHDKSSCYRLMTCDHCHQVGHPTKFCRSFVESMLAMRERVRAGEITAEQLLQQLN